MRDEHLIIMELQWFQSPDNQIFYFTLDGEDSAGADSGRLRGGTGGGTGTSSVLLVKLIDDTEADPVDDTILKSSQEFYFINPAYIY